MTDVSFQALVDAARRGDESAAAYLVREYQTELQRYVRFRMTDPRIRRFVDSLDVCQSVLAAFFVRLRKGQLAIVQPRQLFRFLAAMAENKVKDEVRRHRAVRRGGGVPDGGIPVETIDAAGAEPDPADTVASRELLSVVRGRIRPQDHEIVERWLAGDGWPQIAAAVGGTPDAARKRVDRAIEQAARELGLIEAKP